MFYTQCQGAVLHYPQSSGVIVTSLMELTVTMETTAVKVTLATIGSALQNQVKPSALYDTVNTNSVRNNALWDV